MVQTRSSKLLETPGSNTAAPSATAERVVIDLTSDNEEPVRSPVRSSHRKRRRASVVFNHAREASNAFNTRSSKRFENAQSSSSPLAVASSPDFGKSSPHAKAASVITVYDTDDEVQAEASGDKKKGRRRISGSLPDHLTSLPAEVHQMIAGDLTCAKDVTSYAATNHTIAQYINNTSVWRKHFLAQFDPIDDAGPSEYHEALQLRIAAKGRSVSFEQDYHHVNHPRCTGMLRSLILEANGRREYVDCVTVISSLNMSFIESLMFESVQPGFKAPNGCDIVAAIGKTTRICSKRRSRYSSSKDACTLIIQLVLSHLALEAKPIQVTSADFLTAQRIVYQSERKEPMFVAGSAVNGPQINLRYFLAIILFFKYHLRQQDGNDSAEALFSHIYLEPGNVSPPRAWTGLLDSGTKALSSTWTGTSTSMDSWPNLIKKRGRNSRHYEGLVDSANDHEVGFENLTLFWDTAKIPGMSAFSKAASSTIARKQPALCRDPEDALKENLATYKTFFGIGADDGKQSHLIGAIQALPAYNGIAGWHRISFVRYSANEDGNFGPGLTQSWAYEGIVLPGGEIILGRWWWPNEMDIGDGGPYCGPFIFWNSDEPGDANDIEIALEYLEEIAEHTFGDSF